MSSDLHRARATALSICGRLGLALHEDAGLREQDYGQWQGLTLREIARRWPNEHRAWLHHSGDPVGGETLEAVGRRALDAVRFGLEGVATLLVVTHGDTARALITGLATESDTPTLSPLKNGNCTLLVETDSRWQVIMHNAGPDRAVPVLGSA